MVQEAFDIYFTLLSMTHWVLQMHKCIVCGLTAAIGAISNSHYNTVCAKIEKRGIYWGQREKRNIYSNLEVCEYFLEEMTLEVRFPRIITS